MIAEGICDLTQSLATRGMHITIETAGTVTTPVACDLMSISPKLSNSTPRDRDGGRWVAQHERLRYQPQILRRLIQDHPYQLKFVVTAPEDLEEIRRVVSEIHASADRIVLMPEGTDPGALREKSQWLAEVCKDSGYRFTPRLHVDLWGNRRGV